VAIKIIDKQMMAQANEMAERDKAIRDKKRREKARERGETIVEDPVEPPKDSEVLSQLEVCILKSERSQTHDEIGSSEHYQDLSSD
jgi:quercetin dioxygenase-like cupin family protein